MSTNRQHPDSRQLALLAGGELPLKDRVVTWWHTRRCDACRSAMETYAEARERLRRATFDLLPEDSPEWLRLEAEIKANVRLGLAAGAIVDKDEQETPFAEGSFSTGWQAAIVAASLALVLISGWYLRKPADAGLAAALPLDAQTVIETRDAGIGIQKAGTGMTLLRPAKQSASMEVGFGGAARAQYVDGDTGQVTIHQVYLDE